MDKDTVILLCNLTDAMAEPWLEAGYHVVMVDPQHERTETIGRVTRMACTILDAMSDLGRLIRSGRVALVAGFPPCTDVAVSGARWWEAKRAADPYFQAKAATVAEQCRMIGMLSGAPWFFENPVSAFSKMFGPPTHTFHPYQFSGFCADDWYTKTTNLWAGGGMVMPEHNYDVERYERGLAIKRENERRIKAGEVRGLEDLPPNPDYPDDRIHKAAPGADRGNIRSATPKGFCLAFFLANAPHLRQAANDNLTQQVAA